MYQQLTDACFEGRMDGGVSRARVDALLSQLTGAIADLRAYRDKNAAPLLDIPLRTDDIAAMEALAGRIRSISETVVVAGTGGSGLSGRALIRLLPLGAKPSFHFLENIDPDGIDEVLAHIDCSKTCFLVISKSGTTAETLAQFFVLFDYAAGKLGRKMAAERFFVLTMPEDNLLRRLAGMHGMTVLDHAPIGGRFSILSSVGLLPAAIAGLDIRALRRGAKAVIDGMDTEPEDYSPAIGAALNAVFMEKHIATNVMFAYSERMAGFSAWWRQCWAESLGKHGNGSTPVVAAGTTDQHSQLQLYLDGPKDKLFTLIMLDRAGKGGRINDDDEAPDYLRGKTLGDVMAAEQKATFETLTRHGCPVRLFKLVSLKEEEIGALLMHFMLEIVFTSRLLGVNAFDQPAVEEGKKLAREYLLAGNL